MDPSDDGQLFHDFVGLILRDICSDRRDRSGSGVVSDVLPYILHSPSFDGIWCPIDNLSHCRCVWGDLDGDFVYKRDMASANPHFCFSDLVAALLWSHML